MITHVNLGCADLRPAKNDPMATYLVTGGTGFLGRHVVGRLLERPDARVLLLVRRQSLAKLDALTARWPQAGRLEPVVGDITDPLLGLDSQERDRLRGSVDHVVHLAALYDMTADEETDHRVNIGGTQEALALAGDLQARCFHHVSSVAVAGDHRGRFTESMFDEGQRLPSPYHATKFEAERLVREQRDVPWRVYRPAVIVGHSQTGEMDKVDGPYYFFPTLALLGELPTWLRLVGPDLGDTNVVPVDFVAAAMDELMHRDGLDGEAFHLVAPKPQRLLDVVNVFARAAGAPTVAVPIDRRISTAAADALAALRRIPGAGTVADIALERLGIPPQVLPYATFRPVFDAARTQRLLDGTGIAVPALESYADVLWQWWSHNLDPLRARRDRPSGNLAGRTVVITGASSGIGRSAALAVARRDGVPLIVARSADKLEEVRDEISAAGGTAFVYPCDITDEEAVSATVKQMIADHPDGIDFLVNNAGRSIRRSVRLSYDRMHDYERTMSLNYFAAVRMILALLPHMTERQFGHVVNVSSIGVQTAPPRFSAYVASKAALDAFSRVVASETYGDGVTFTTIHMPLVRTPMIRPTRIYDAFPTLTPDDAAEMVVRALTDRPKRISTRLGTFGEVSYAVAPKMVDAVLHVAYRVFPDSRAAGGDDQVSLSRGARAMARLLPGVHW
jgi:thioester reductase-like protein/short-subunit dehydrogenase involved in D-alanine esterification of teichoic acids